MGEKRPITENGYSDESPERLIKSEGRVRDLGEVFTPRQTVDEMLDLLPRDMWRVHPSRTFLEPACGDGNFLVAILERKLERVVREWEKGKAPAGRDTDALAFHSLESLSSIYGVDISKENVFGGVPQHPIGARERMLKVFTEALAGHLQAKLGSRSRLHRAAEWVVERNIQIANMLPFDQEGNPTGWDQIPILEYSWDPESLRVAVSRWRLGQVQDLASGRGGGAGDNLSLLSEGVEAEPVWSGRFNGLFEAVTPRTRRRVAKAA